MGGKIGIVEDHLLVVPVEPTGIMVVGMPLAVVAKEEVESLGIGITAGVGRSQPPLSNCCRDISPVFKKLCNGDLLRR